MGGEAAASHLSAARAGFHPDTGSASPKASSPSCRWSSSVLQSLPRDVVSGCWGTHRTLPHHSARRSISGGNSDVPHTQMSSGTHPCTTWGKHPSSRPVRLGKAGTQGTRAIWGCSDLPIFTTAPKSLLGLPQLPPAQCLQKSPAASKGPVVLGRARGDGWEGVTAGLADEQRAILIYAKSSLEKLTFLLVCIYNIQKP